MLSWASFKTDFFAEYSQGEHVLAIGQNGSGKTYLELSLMSSAYSRGAWEAVFWTKPKDMELDRFQKYHPGKIVDSPGHNFAKPPRMVYVRPKAKTLGELKDTQTQVFEDALNGIWNAGNWIIYLDEIRYLSQLLGLTTELQIMYTQARSSGIGLWAGIQRPRWMPVEALTEVKHFFIGQLSDRQDKKRVAEVIGYRAVQLSEQLNPHEFIYARPGGYLAKVRAA